MKRDKIDSYLGFCARAGKLACGYNTCMYMMKRIKLLIIACGVSGNSIKKLTARAEKEGTAYRIYGDSERLCHATGTGGKSIFGITDSGLAEKIKEEIDKNPVSGRCFNDDKNS